ncbi:MinD/ParA family ATP-binding protein [Nocardia brasiliensis]
MTEIRIDLSALDPAGAPSPLTAASPPGSPTDPVPVRGVAMHAIRRTEAPPVLVLGTSGGAGSTTTAWGLASAAATEETTESDPVAVDLTPYGTDLAERGCDAQAPVATIGTWLSCGRPSLPSAVTTCSGLSSAGVRILSRDANPLPRRETALSIARHLAEAGGLPVYDAGAPVTSRLAAPLLSDSRVALVLVCSARPDLVNRLRPALIRLDDEFGEFLLSRAVVAITEQSPGTGQAAAAHVADWLGTHIRAVRVIPFDAHMATGQRLSWSALGGATRQSFRLLWGDLQ